MNVLRLLCCVGCIALVGSWSGAQEAVQSELIFPLHPKHNHAPGIAELPSGELIVSWFRGSGERTADDVAVYGARRPVGSRQWSEPFVMVDTPGFPDGNTCLMVDTDGRLFLFWPLVLANTWESCVTQMLISEQPEGIGSPQWTRRDSLWLKPKDFSPQALEGLDKLLGVLPESAKAELDDVVKFRERVQDKLYQRLGWQGRCKPTVLPSGRILLPLYSDTFSFSIMAISDDRGLTWHASEPLMGFGNIQPSVLRRNDGTLVAYMRENGPRRQVRVSESSDDGQTWGPVGTIPIANPGSGLDAVQTRSGNWLLISNNTIVGRNRLAISVSKDEGQSWPITVLLEDQPKGAYHYPAIIQTRDGKIHAVYSYFSDEGKSMKHVEFEEAYLLGQ
ncbi:MAG: exo-alpha-sialidase [Pirellulaceae bacterium]|nr:exo-alpha-sialidase [Pirellulaceae bacterium]